MSDPSLPRPELSARRVLGVELGDRRYDITIGAGLLGDASLFDGFAGRPLRVITDANVAAGYLDPVLDALGLTRDHAYILPAGETQKTWRSAESLLDWLLASRISRDGVLVALGGGVIGDLTGFVAAIYQRGIAFVQIPTTLLAQVDSSVGGKTGVNHARGKNLIGAFHQPVAVIADTATLATLPARELSAGLAEVIKCAMLGDAGLFARLERDLDLLLSLEPTALADAIERCCQLKARIVGLDERETLSGGPRMLLNLGHTFAHAVETYTKYESWLHGEAVGLGLVMAADLSARLGWLKPEDSVRCLRLVERAKLPVAPPAGMTPDDFRSLMSRDKKVAAGRLRLVLMRGLGDAVTTTDVPAEALDATLAQFCTAAAAA